MLLSVNTSLFHLSSNCLSLSLQSLIMVFAHLVHSQLEPLLEFLCSLPGPTGKPALEFVMTEWMSRQHLFYGQYEGKVRLGNFFNTILVIHPTNSSVAHIH